MKIKVRGEGHSLTIPIPNSLAFSRLSIRFILRTLRSDGEFLPSLSDREAEQVLYEMGRAIKKCGHWELVHVEGANGELVSITM